MAPTFNDEFSIIPYLKQPLRSYIPEFLNVIIKLHGVTSQEISSAFKQMAANSNNVYLCEDYDISECFVAADILISDMSSVIYEFLAMDKPVLLFDSPRQKEYTNYNPDDIEYKYRDVGLRFEDVNRLPELLFRGLTEKRDGAVDQIADGFVSVKDGSSAAKVVVAANELLKDEKKRDIHIVLIDNNITNTNRVKQRFEDRFNISVLPADSERITFLKLKELADNINESMILVHDTNYEMSPQMPNFLLSHLLLMSQTGLVVPLIYNDEISYQQAKLRVRLNNDLSLGTMALQLTYSFAGQSIEIPFAERISYAFKKDKLVELGWYAFLGRLKEQDLSIELSFDSMIYPCAEPVIMHHQEAADSKADFVFANDSEDDLKQMIQDHPFDDDKKIALIEYYYKNEMWANIETYASMISSHYKAMWYLARSLEEKGSIEKAYNKLDINKINMIKEPYWKAKCFALKGKLSMKLSKAIEAKNYIEQALFVDPKNVDALIVRAAYNLLNNDIRNAESDYLFILSIEPQNRLSLIGMGMIKLFSQDFVAAEDYYLSALKLNEEDLEAINGLVKSVWQTRHFEKAINALNLYLEFHPANLDILFTISGIYYETKQFSEAVEHLETIMLFEEDYPGAKDLYNKIVNVKNKEGE